MDPEQVDTISVEALQAGFHRAQHRKIGTLGFAVYSGEAFRGVDRKEWKTLLWLAFPREFAWLAEMKWLEQMRPERVIRSFAKH
ncbi:hypothetical protein J2X06_002517 [Lysobacter niastensis]|uniref:Uncharacterized protein n=1 Tax=Lysobacter niastensis TaxID=380629 RepID=A0ABU1WCG6_9GAMM|nr:hypothetical protein [Lysobacter niastensis]MDR7135308.1 hypothetical protein [Lysobacter niastensis]